MPDSDRVYLLEQTADGDYTIIKASAGEGEDMSVVVKSAPLQLYGISKGAFMKLVQDKIK